MKPINNLRLKGTQGTLLSSSYIEELSCTGNRYTCLWLKGMSREISVPSVILDHFYDASHLHKRSFLGDAIASQMRPLSLAT